MRLMVRDKKVLDGQLRLVLMRKSWQRSGQRSILSAISINAKSDLYISLIALHTFFN